MTAVALQPNAGITQRALPDRCLFSSAGEILALPVTLVAEVVALDELVALPRCPAALLGIINLRGELIPVVDLAALRSASPPIPSFSAQTLTARALVLRRGAWCVALRVDHVLGLGDAEALAAAAGTALDAGELVAGLDALLPARGPDS